MPLELPYGYTDLNPEGSSNVDTKYGYYNSISEALNQVPLAMRKGGRTVGIKQGDGTIVEYWWENDNDLTNDGLVKKIAEPFDPSDYDLDEFNNAGQDPYVRNSEITAPTLQEVIDKSANGGNYVFASFPSGNEIEDDGGGLIFKGDVTIASANGEEIIRAKDTGTTATLEGTTGNNGDFLVNVDGNGRVGWRKLLDDTVISLTKLWSSQKISDELASKVDKVTGKGLSPEEFTLLEKQKLAGLESSKWRGLYLTKSALELANPTPEGGDYADVDAGTGVDTIRYVYDETDDDWIESGSGTPLTGAQIKVLYEGEPDTNAFDDTRKNKLDSITAIFTTALKNAYDNVVNWVSTNGQNLLDHLSDKNNPHEVTKGQVGLGNVNNTSDAAKPISTAQQNALNLKANDADISTVGKSNDYNDLDNLPDLIALGETSSTAYRGDRGKTAYDHSQADHAPADAQKNVKSDWDAITGDAEILNKPTNVSEFINDGNTLSPYATLADIYKSNALLSYGITQVSGYSYNVWADRYIINNVLYTTRIEDTVTLDPAHPTLDRFDGIMIKVVSGGPNEIIVKTGIPSENPVSPNIDTQTELLVRFILVKAGTVEPDIDIIQIYDENLGNPTEWTATKTGDTELANTEYASKGTKSIKIPINLDYTDAVLTAPTPVPFSEFTGLLMDVRTDEPAEAFIIDVNGVYIDLIYSGHRGYIGDGNWHTISIAMEEILAKLEMAGFADPAAITTLKLWKDNPSRAVWIDNIRLIKDESSSGGTPPVIIQKTSDIPINDGATGVSPYAEMRDLPAPFDPTDYDLDQFKNEGQDPFARESQLFDPTQLENDIQDLENNKQDNLGFTPENLENKATTLAGADDTTYPTTKAVADELDKKQIKDLAYGTIALMLAGQANQSEGQTIRVDDASADTNLIFPTGANKVAYYKYDGVAGSPASIADYTLISAPYATMKAWQVVRDEAYTITPALYGHDIFIDDGITTFNPNTQAYQDNFEVLLINTSGERRSISLVAKTGVTYMVNGVSYTSLTFQIETGGAIGIFRKLGTDIYIIRGQIV